MLFINFLAQLATMQAECLTAATQANKRVAKCDTSAKDPIGTSCI